jgi:hypothetical protein
MTAAYTHYYNVHEIRLGLLKQSITTSVNIWINEIEIFFYVDSYRILFRYSSHSNVSKYQVEKVFFFVLTFFPFTLTEKVSRYIISFMTNNKTDQHRFSYNYFMPMHDIRSLQKMILSFYMFYVGKFFLHIN